MKFVVSVTALLCAVASAQKLSLVDLELDLPGILPVVIPTNTTDSVEAASEEPEPCLDDPDWFSGYGNCTSYAEGGYNDGFCESDSDETTGVLASEACPVSCLTCPEPEPVAAADDASASSEEETEGCVDDDTWVSENGDKCSDYSDGTRTPQFCWIDVSSEGVAGVVACRKSCDTCKDIVTFSKSDSGEIVETKLAESVITEEPKVDTTEASAEGGEVSARAADLSGCGVNRDCPACASTYGCTWNKVSGCTAGFGQSVCDAIATPDSSKSDCEAYTDCKQCTGQAGCIFYQGQCTYSRGTGCLNDPFNCANYPSQCPATPQPTYPQPQPPQPQPQPPQPQPDEPQAQCTFPPCFQPGSYCNAFQTCGSGSELVCQNNTCQPVQQCLYPPCGIAGAVCNYYQGCGGNGLTCQNGRCMTDTSIVTPKPVTCNPPFALCPQGEQCGPNFICQPIPQYYPPFGPQPEQPSPDNQACNVYVGPYCPQGQYCDGTKCVTDPNVPKLDICFYDYQCPNNYTCVNSKCTYGNAAPIYYTETTNTNTQPTYTNTNTQPTYTNTNVQPTYTNTNVQPTYTNTNAQPTYTNTNPQPTYTNTNPQPTYNNNTNNGGSIGEFCIDGLVNCSSGLSCQNNKCVYAQNWSG